MGVGPFLLRASRNGVGTSRARLGPARRLAPGTLNCPRLSGPCPTEPGLLRGESRDITSTDSVKISVICPLINPIAT